MAPRYRWCSIACPHIFRMAEAIVAGAREVAGTEVSLYQVAELVPDEARYRDVLL